MAEQNSRQSAKTIAGTKLQVNEYGRLRVAVIQMPATSAFANGDTMGGVIVPAGSRFTAGSLASIAAGAASSTVSIGIRDPLTKVAIDATAIANAVSLTTAAAGLALNNGTKLTGGADYVTTQDVEVYLTFGGAAPSANQQGRFEIEYVGA